MASLARSDERMVGSLRIIDSNNVSLDRPRSNYGAALGGLRSAVGAHIWPALSHGLAHSGTLPAVACATTSEGRCFPPAVAGALAEDVSGAAFAYAIRIV